MKKINYIFPIYNEEGTIDKLYEEISKAIKPLLGKYEVEIIFINDGSKDSSLEKLVSLQKRDKKITVLNFSRNYGHQMAVTAGLDYSDGEAVIIMDSDLQDPPKVSLELIKKWEEGYEVVYAQRRTRQDTFFKKTTAHIFYRVLARLSSVEIPKDTGDFRLMDKKVVNEMKRLTEHDRFLRGIVASLGFNQTAVLFDRDKRFAGKTNYPLKKMIKLAVDGIVSFSNLPLKLITQVGFFVSFLSFFGVVYALVMKFFYPEVTVSGWTMIAISIFFIGGVQLIMLGVVGEYVGRIYVEVQNRPLYVISSIFTEKKNN